jgi:hypothetical protein
MPYHQVQNKTPTWKPYHFPYHHKRYLKSCLSIKISWRNEESKVCKEQEQSANSSFHEEYEKMTKCRMEDGWMDKATRISEIL